MAKRMIHRRFFESLDIADLTISQRYLLVGLIAQADDQGRLPGDPRWINSKVYPYDNLACDVVAGDLEKIATTEDTLQIYEVDERPYLQLVNWWNYQNLQWATPSNYPPPEGWTDRIRQLQYKPKRWVMTLNWPGSEDKVSNGESAPNPLGNALPNSSPISNTITNPSISNSIKGGMGGKENPKAIPLPVHLGGHLRTELENKWDEWQVYQHERGKAITKSTANRQFQEFYQWGPEQSIIAIDESIKNNWTGVFEPKKQSNNGKDAQPGTWAGAQEIYEEEQWQR